MNLFFRFLRIFLPAYFSGKRTAPLDVHVIKSAVWIGDHDPMGHMTNSRYASFTDLGMLNYIARTGFLKVFRQHGWTPIIRNSNCTHGPSAGKAAISCSNTHSCRKAAPWPKAGWWPALSAERRSA